MSRNNRRRFGQIINVPVLGYLLDFVISIFRLPKNNMRVKQIRQDLWQQKQQMEQIADHQKQRIEQIVDQQKQQIQQLVDQQKQQAEQLVDQQKQMQVWSRQMPEFLNTVSSVGAIGHELHWQKQNSNEISRRIEFVRKEILLELAARTGAPTRKIEPTILDAVSFQNNKAAGARLNLGCGHVPLEGFLNIDMRELPGVDIAAQLDNIPFEKGSVKEIFSSHVLEHFTREHLRRDLLPYWRSLLQKGGSFRAVAPDGKAMAAALASGDMSFEDFREVLLGGQEYEGNFHYDFFSAESMSELLMECGFVNVQIVAKGRRNGKCYEFEIMATNS